MDLILLITTASSNNVGNYRFKETSYQRLDQKIQYITRKHGAQYAFVAHLHKGTPTLKNLKVFLHTKNIINLINYLNNV